jgi:Uma2 family endonuclease
MSTIIGPTTAEDLFAMPEDGIERELIRGQLREKLVSSRGLHHSLLISRLSDFLSRWLVHHPVMRGAILSADVAVRLCREPETVVGIDVAFFTAEALSNTFPGQSFTEGPPVLAVEVMSPSDTFDGIADRMELYLEHGVTVVWIVNPRFHTITVHRANDIARIFDFTDELDGEPELPGFRAPMVEIFTLNVGGEPR